VIVRGAGCTSRSSGVYYRLANEAMTVNEMICERKAREMLEATEHEMLSIPMQDHLIMLSTMI
jgi:hypothetical protein